MLRDGTEVDLDLPEDAVLRRLMSRAPWVVMAPALRIPLRYPTEEMALLMASHYADAVVRFEPLPGIMLGS